MPALPRGPAERRSSPYQRRAYSAKWPELACNEPWGDLESRALGEPRAGLPVYPEIRSRPKVH